MTTGELLDRLAGVDRNVRVFIENPDEYCYMPLAEVEVLDFTPIRYSGETYILALSPAPQQPDEDEDEEEK